MNLHVFRNTIFVILCLNNFFFYFGLSVVHVHLSAYASSIGFTEYHGAMLFSALGIANFAGCIMLGLIGNTPCITSIALCTMSYFIMGASAIISPLIMSYVGLVLFAVVFGFFRASCGTIYFQVMADILSVELLASCMGYSLVFAALGSLLGAPTAGRK